MGSSPLPQLAPGSESKKDRLVMLRARAARVAAAQAGPDARQVRSEAAASGTVDKTRDALEFAPGSIALPA